MKLTLIIGTDLDAKTRAGAEWLNRNGEGKALVIGMCTIFLGRYMLPLVSLDNVDVLAYTRHEQIRRTYDAIWIDAVDNFYNNKQARKMWNAVRQASNNVCFSFAPQTTPLIMSLLEHPDAQIIDLNRR